MQASKAVPGFLPVLGLLFSATLWGISWYPLRLLQQHGLEGLWAIIASYSAAMLAGLWLLWRYRGEIARAPGFVLALALSSGWCNAAFIMAVLDGTVVRVMLLFYLSPIWTVLLGWLLLGEAMSRRSLAIFSIAMTGAVIMLWDPETGSLLPSGHADWLALSSGLAFAVSNVLVRRLRQTSLFLKAASNWAGVLGIAILWVWFADLPRPEVVSHLWWSAAALGLAGFALATLSLQYGVTQMPVHRSAVILLFQLVVGALSSLALASERIEPREWLGGVFVIMAALLSSRIREPEP